MNAEVQSQFEGAFDALSILERELSRLEELVRPQLKDNEIFKSLRSHLSAVEWDVSHMMWEYEE